MKTYGCWPTDRRGNLLTVGVLILLLLIDLTVLGLTRLTRSGVLSLGDTLARDTARRLAESALAEVAGSIRDSSDLQVAYAGRDWRRSLTTEFPFPRIRVRPAATAALALASQPSMKLDDVDVVAVGRGSSLVSEDLLGFIDLSVRVHGLRGGHSASCRVVQRYAFTIPRAAQMMIEPEDDVLEIRHGEPSLLVRPVTQEVRS